jgi:hypothetical protein
VKNAKIGAQKDKITEKRHFPMVFVHKTFNYSIPPIHQQITIIKMVCRGIKYLQKISIHPLLVENPLKSGI